MALLDFAWVPGLVARHGVRPNHASIQAPVCAGGPELRPHECVTTAATGPSPTAGGDAKPVITGLTLVSFAFGLLSLWFCSARRTDQPRWLAAGGECDRVPACIMGIRATFYYPA